MKRQEHQVAAGCNLLILSIVGVLACAEQSPPQDTGAEPGSLLWEHAVGAEIWSPLTLERGVLYFGSDDGKVRALDTASRTVRWEFSTAARVRSAVSIIEETALFSSDDGFLYALDQSAGSELWRFDLGAADVERRLPAIDPPYGYDYRQSMPVAAGGRVFAGSANGTLFAIDRETGREQWRVETGGKIRATPAVHDGTVYFGSWDGILRAVDAETGRSQWDFDTGGTIQGAVAVADGKVLAGSRSATLFAVEADSGELAWKHVHEDGSWVESPPVIRDGVVYIGSSDALKLFALDLGSGETIWSFKTNGWSWGAPVVADGVVYIGGVSASPYYFEGVELEAGFYAVDRETGTLIWSWIPPPIEGFVTGGVFSSPAVAAGVVYVAGLDGSVYALSE